MPERILITGGAGFIGSHLARRLLRDGHEVRALDRLDPQVHPERERPAYLEDGVELIVGDVRDPAAVQYALHGVDAVVHLAARVGVGQSMYEIDDYCSVNTVGTGVLLEALMKHRVRRLLVASSMSIYGEGEARTADGDLAWAVERNGAQLERGEWEPRDREGRELIFEPTPETKTPSLSSVYALNKYDQERMCLLFGSSYGVPTTALRFFNVYGPDQALSNPYTGVLAIFGGRLLNDRSVYDLVEVEGSFEVVLFMGVLYHLRYPLLALDVVAEKVGGTLVLQTLTMPGEEPAGTPEDLEIGKRRRLTEPGWPRAAFVEHKLAGDPTNWWPPTPPASKR